MKINLSLPDQESKYLSHDSPLISAIGVGIVAFLALSSLTVFLGVKSHIAGYLAGLSPYISYPAYGIGYLVFSLAPDALNVVCVAFVARSFLLNFYKDRRSVILIAVCIVTSFYLTGYSFEMSQVSAEALARSITPEEQSPDVIKFDTTLQNVVSSIGADFDQEYNRLSTEYDRQIEASNRAHEARKSPHLRQITRYEKSRNDGNTQWIDKRIDREQQKIESIESERVQKAANLTEEKRLALADLRVRRTTMEDRAQLAADSSKAIIVAGAEKKNANLAAVTNTMIRQLSGIAGKSIFILLALSVVREILRNRNSIKPVPIWSEFDFGGNPVKEIFMFIPTYVGRWVLRSVRGGYEGIRAKGMPAPERPGILYDWTTAQNEIGVFEIPDDTTPADTPTTPAKPRKKPRQKRKRKATTTTTAKKSRPIGFNVPFSDNRTTAINDGTPTAKSTTATGSNNRPVTNGEGKIVYREIDSSLRACLKCGESYKPRAHNQKFCSRRCKDQYHTDNHDGRRFDPGKYHGRKS